ncbi:hypothetical protein AVEN_94258-1 [Araneus ventricosus]|uniref:Uncharacterized protein n=1 Tax=Araneus ventricosus TaxID=182803 RepID=A0A4Y2SFT2_ARAVE|nr:hypothetical protein AVEN_94258-1 [Araneus ventricosus]
MVKNKDKVNPEESEEEDVSTDFVSYADTSSALELVQRYDMQNSTNAAALSDSDMIFMRRWSYITLSGSVEVHQESRHFLDLTPPPDVRRSPRPCMSAIGNEWDVQDLLHPDLERIALSALL